MVLAYTNGEQVSESAGLLISILMRYPEICAISFNPEDDIITLSISFGEPISERQFLETRGKLINCLQAYSYLEKKDEPKVSVLWTTIDEISLLKIKYNVKTMSRNEIVLMMSFLQDDLGDSVIKEADAGEPPEEDDLLVQEEFIGHMLENFKVSAPQKKLIAFREEGKVHIFKK